MRSPLREVRNGAAVWRWGWCWCWLLLLATATKPDWMGSRYGEWNTAPNDNWYQYKCDIPGCDQRYQCLEKLSYQKLCRIHTSAIMTLAYDPTKG